MAKRTPVSIEFEPQRLLQTLVHAATQDGLPPADLTEYTRERGDRRLIVVAAAPRTGSTFLTNALRAYTGFPRVRLCSGYSTNEHDLYLPALCIFNRSGGVSQLHIKGSYHNAALARAFDVKLVILTRDIFDIVLSLRRDLRRKEGLSGYGSGLNGYPFLWQDQDIAALDDTALTDAIIDLALPWYVNFYVSWYRLCAQDAVTAQWLRYEAVMADKAGTMQRLLDAFGLGPAAGDAAQALAVEYETYGGGRSGRGREALSMEQQARIRRLFAYYPDVDFGGYGLSP